MQQPEAPALVTPTLSNVTDQPVEFHFDNTYARLPEQFYVRIAPSHVAAPRLVKLNTPLAQQLGLDPRALATSDGVDILAGNAVATGAEPLALAYAGHQFGHFVPQLGDGRANLLGEVLGQDGRRYDIQLKGSGPTPFSRRGDGRAALGPVLREYLLSEAMAALGVPTTRAMAAVTTGQQVLREVALPGAVLTRVAASHLRIGTFQYFAARGDVDALRRLADYAIARHYSDIMQASAARPYRAFLEGVVGRQARLVAQWMLLGFVHGVMNTDNMSISGETIDYGPCAFLEAYDPATVFSSIDVQGRYAYGNQPLAALWNLTRLAETLLPLLALEEGSEEAAVASATEVLNSFDPEFQKARQAGLRRKLGLLIEREGDTVLTQDLLDLMAANHADFTLTFRSLCRSAMVPTHDAETRRLFKNPGAYDAWAVRWHGRQQQEPHENQARVAVMRSANPAFIPRNHMVEAALEAATWREDFQPFESLVDATSRPYEDRPELERYTRPATREEAVFQTFCGT